MKFFRSVSVLMVSCLLSLSVLAAETWTINQKDADIRTFVEQIAEITGRTFIVDPGVKGKITVISNEKLGQQGIYEVFLTVLQIHGYAALEQDGVVKVIKQSVVKSSGVDLDNRNTQTGQDLVTRVIFVQNRSAMELVPLLRPMVAKYGHLAGVNSANAIIISDHAYNIERIQTLIKSLDILNSEEIEVVQLEEAWVGNIVGLLEKLVPEEVAAQANRANQGSRKIRVVADERSNSIILKGEKTYRDRIRALINKLDQPSAQNASSKVIFLNNADAKKMAELLKGFSGAVEKTQQQQGGKGAPPTSPTAILADEDLNALVIRAEPTVLAEIEDVVASLDVPRAQVLIEAAIVEVKGGMDNKLGIQWITNPENSENSGAPFAATQFSEGGATLSGVAASVAQSSLPDTGFILGFADEGLNIGAILQAVESQSNANILSTPSIMTLDNNEASILVGGTVPFKTTTQSGSGGNPFTTITREDIGTNLIVIPHIQNDGTIRLEVDQKTESVNTKSTEGAVDLETSKREIKTEVLVGTGETIVLGGLISDEVTEGVSKVPLLGDIPGLGVLFRAKFKRHEKVNLFVFIRPTIVKDKVTEFSQSKLNGIWELRMGDDLPPGQSPSFEQIFSGTAIPTKGSQK